MAGARLICCPRCGRRIPRKQWEFRFTGVQREIYRTVRKAGSFGITTSELLDRLSSGRAEPAMPSPLRREIYRMNLILRPYLEIVSLKRGRLPALYVMRIPK